jgi:septal ring factor EnvC (AmiA/AmiB activator)
MRVLPTCALLLSLSAIPGFAQSNQSDNSSTVLPANANDASVDYSALRQRLADQNKTLTAQVTNQRSVVKKNQELLKEAQKLDASNKKLMEEKKKLEAENTDLEKQRQALKSSQSQIQTAQADSKQ